MPWVSDATLAKVQTRIQAVKRGGQKALVKGERVAGKLKVTGEMGAGAGLAGALRGYMEKTGRSMNIPGTTIDGQLVVSLGLVGMSIFDVFGKYSEDVGNVANGSLCHYIGQFARNSVQSGKFTMVAGDVDDTLSSVLDGSLGE